MNTQYGNDFLFTSRSSAADINIRTGVSEKLWIHDNAIYAETGKGDAGQSMTSTTSLIQLVASFVGSPVVNYYPDTFDTSVSGSIIVKETGLYLVTAYATVPANSTGIRILSIYGDNDELSRETIVTTPNVFCRVNHNIPLLITAGTSVNIRYAQNSGSTLDIAASFLSIQRLGRA